MSALSAVVGAGTMSDEPVDESMACEGCGNIVAWYTRASDELRIPAGLGWTRLRPGPGALIAISCGRCGRVSEIGSESPDTTGHVTVDPDGKVRLTSDQLRALLQKSQSCGGSVTLTAVHDE